MEAFLAQFRMQRLDGWLDDPIPALNNVSPRVAAKTVAGRVALDQLLTSYESAGAHEQEDLGGLESLSACINPTREFVCDQLRLRTG